MFNGKSVLVTGGTLGCEEFDLKVSVSAVEAWGFVCPTRGLHRKRISN